MKIVHHPPLIYPLLKWRFPEIDFYGSPTNTVITIADTIYSAYPMASHILRHEMVHIRQQKGSKLYAYLYFIPRYFLDREFRERMEAEGHAAE